MARQMNIQCPNCRNPITAVVESVIDATSDPQAKARFLSGRVNNVTCPNCGTPVSIATPVLYHDGTKELLLVYVPMETPLPKQQQEKVIGELMKELTSKLPKEAMKGYLFNPKQALTLQGMLDTILQADGVTPEMMNEQRDRVRLIETFMSTPEDILQSVVEQNDTKVDAQFLQTMSLMAQRMMQENRADLAQQVLAVQERVAAYSSFGQELVERNREQEETVREVAAELQALGNDATRADFIELALRYGADANRLQALVGLARPAFDYQFFTEFTTRIGGAPADQRDALESVREQLVQLTQMVDQQQQMVVQEAAQLLQSMVNSPDIDAAVDENMPYLDDTFMAVLSANIQEAQRAGNIQLSARLKLVYDRVVAALRDNMQPELRFINDLLSLPEEQARTALAEQVADFGPPLIEMMDAVQEILSSRGEGELLEKLATLREDAVQALQ